MATSAAIGFGLTLGIGNGATPEVFTSLGEVTALTLPSLTRETVDATHHASPGRYREMIAALRKAGPASVTINYVPNGGSWALLKAAYDSDNPKNYRVTLPGGATVTFAGFADDLSEETPLADKMSLTAKITPTGAPTWA